MGQLIGWLGLIGLFGWIYIQSMKELEDEKTRGNSCPKEE